MTMTESSTTPVEPSEQDVETLGELLKMAGELSDNEESAKFLLSSDWMRARLGQPLLSSGERLFRDLDNGFLANMQHLAGWILRQRAASTPVTHPAWCNSTSCDMDYDPEKTHPEDWMSSHESEAVDRWVPNEADAHDEIAVFVRGSRHPNRDKDWPDQIHASNTAPGSMGDVTLEVASARRLAHALLKACDLAETDPAAVNA